MTLLSVVRNACSEIGIDEPQQVASSADTQTRQLLRLLNREGRELARMQWQAITKEYQFQTVPGVESYTLPNDYCAPINQTHWSKSLRWRMLGPLSAEEWQHVKSGIVSVGPRTRFRILGNRFQVNPIPQGQEILGFEYLSKNWVTSDEGERAEYLKDTDLSHLSEDLLTMGLIWRWKGAKGLEYSADLEQYRRAVDRDYGRDKGARALNLGARNTYHFEDAWGAMGNTLDIGGITIQVAGEQIAGPQGAQGPTGPAGPSGATPQLIPFTFLASITGPQDIDVSIPGLPTGSSLSINGLEQNQGVYTFNGTRLSISAAAAVVAGDTVTLEYYPA